MCTPIGSTSTSATGTVIWNCVTGSTPGDVVISVTADPTGDHQMPEAGLGSALCGWEKLCWHVTCAAVCAVPACLPACTRHTSVGIAQRHNWDGLCRRLWRV